MNEIEEVVNALNILYELKEQLEQDLSDINNHITTKAKKQTIRRLRLVNNAIYAGEKAKLSLEAEKEKTLNLKPKTRRRY